MDQYIAKNKIFLKSTSFGIFYVHNLNKSDTVWNIYLNKLQLEHIYRRNFFDMTLWGISLSR